MVSICLGPGGAWVDIPSGLGLKALAPGCRGHMQDNQGPAAWESLGRAYDTGISASCICLTCRLPGLHVLH